MKKDKLIWTGNSFTKGFPGIKSTADKRYVVVGSRRAFTISFARSNNETPRDMRHE